MEASELLGSVGIFLGVTCSLRQMWYVRERRDMSSFSVVYVFGIWTCDMLFLFQAILIWNMSLITARVLSLCYSSYMLICFVVHHGASFYPSKDDFSRTTGFTTCSTLEAMPPTSDGDAATRFVASELTTDSVRLEKVTESLSERVEGCYQRHADFGDKNDGSVR